MPNYTYKCSKDNSTTIVFHKIAELDTHSEPCPICNEIMSLEIVPTQLKHIHFDSNGNKKWSGIQT
jgi:predicted nucleic acid-binding Zn ribbon protein